MFAAQPKETFFAARCGHEEVDEFGASATLPGVAFDGEARNIIAASLEVNERYGLLVFVLHGEVSAVG
jgi:hypothetical protein